MSTVPPKPGELYRPPIFWVGCCVLFLLFAISLIVHGQGQFGDTDPLWHIATGDLIRANQAIPMHDPWSFTAGNYPWINISWLWDVIFSWIHQELGWHGAIAANGMIIAIMIVFVFTNCIDRGGHWLAVCVALFAASSMFSMMLRPLQFSSMMVAIWLWILASTVRGQIRPIWLFTLPLMMLAWVNIHGGFMVGLMLLGAFFLQTLFDKNYALAKPLFLTGVALVPALLCNPYGVQMYVMVLTQMHPVFAPFAHEWQPLVTSFTNLHNYFYIVAFPILTIRRPLGVLPVERWLAYLWFFLGLTSNRHLTMFAIISAPVVAASLQGYCMRMPPIHAEGILRESMLFVYNRRIVATLMLILCGLVVVLLPSPMAAHLFKSHAVAPPSLKPEIEFLQKNYPHVHLLNHYDLGGILIYETRGKIPVFVDPRGETAVPPAVMEDYVLFVQSKPGWEEILDRYHLDAIMIPNVGHDDFFDRFQSRQGWKEVFKGPVATLFIRTPVKE